MRDVAPREELRRTESQMKWFISKMGKTGEVADSSGESRSSVWGV